MKVATILFTYNRPEHTKRVLEALKLNDILPEKLFIFQDGKKENTDLEKWKEVTQIINAVTWCETEIHISDKNKGLAKSVVGGLNYVFKYYDGVIVLEDDCVPHPEFMDFMYKALHKYDYEKKVYSISGYAWAVFLDKEKCDADAYFNGRISSWGWGTWKDRWSQYEQDYSILRRIERDPVKNKALQIWGQDLKDMLLGNVDGRCDSWAVFWALKVIEKGGLCLSPFKSLIENIGLDGSGTHSGTIRIDVTQQNAIDRSKCVLPEKIECIPEYEQEFEMYFSRVPRIKSLEMTRSLLCEYLMRYGQFKNVFASDAKIAIWGKGVLCDLLLETVLKENLIACIIESYPTVKFYKNIPVVDCTEMPEGIDEIVVVPFWDIEKIRHRLNKENIVVNIHGIDEILLNY